MRYITEADTDPKLASLLDAAQQEPIFIDRGQQEGAVLISARQYDRLSGKATREFLDFCDTVADNAAANGLTEAKLEELLNNA